LIQMTSTGRLVIKEGGNEMVFINPGAARGALRVDQTAVIINGLNAAYDFRVDGDTNDNLFFVDASPETINLNTYTEVNAVTLNDHDFLEMIPISEGSIGMGFSNSSGDSKFNFAYDELNDYLVLYTEDGGTSILNVFSDRIVFNEEYADLDFLINGFDSDPAYHFISQTGNEEHIWKTGDVERMRINSSKIRMLSNLSVDGKIEVTTGNDICIEGGNCLSTIGGDNASWNESYADTLYADISVTGDNSSWNESYADTLYIAQADEGDLNVNSSTWWAGISGWLGGWFTQVGNDLQFNETKLNETIDARDTDTTYSAGNGISLATTTFSVAGNTALTQDADGLSVTADGIGDTQLEFDTGQELTTASDVAFNQLNVSDHFKINSVNITCFNSECTWFTNATDSCMYWASGGKDCGAA